MMFHRDTQPITTPLIPQGQEEYSICHAMPLYLDASPQNPRPLYSAVSSGQLLTSPSKASRSSMLSEVNGLVAVLTVKSTAPERGSRRKVCLSQRRIMFSAVSMDLSPVLNGSGWNSMDFRLSVG